MARAFLDSDSTAGVIYFESESAITSSMLKDREKRIEQDQIWKKICEELGWTFIPTV